MPTATLTSKGQITLPKEVRERLQLRAGDRVDFDIDSSGEIRLRVARGDIENLRGILHRPGQKALSLEDMDAAIRRRGQP